MEYLTASEVLFIHSVLIDETGGEHGIQDVGLLESALAQPRQSFGGHDLHPTLVGKAAALACSLMKNHPFLDGNKRTAVTVMGVFLELNGRHLKATQNELAEFAMNLAEEKYNVLKTSRWIQEHIELL